MSIRFPFQTPIDVWAIRPLLLDDVRPSPLLMHLSPPDVEPPTLFWNRLRHTLPSFLRVHWVDDWSDAGSLVITPNTLQAYYLSNRLGEALQLNRQLLETGRQVITFTGGIEYRPKPGEWVFATSTYRSTDDRAIATPNWLYDLGQMPVLDKPTLPTVGFVGDTSYPGRLSRCLQPIPVPESAIDWLGGSLAVNRTFRLRFRQQIARLVRQSVLQQVRQFTHLQLDLIERNGGYFSRSDDEQEQMRREYLSNMAQNAYILCIRGDENCSYRLYETLSAGRIPVIIDTHMRLPTLPIGLNWDDFCIIVPYRELHQIEERILAFHQTLPPVTFQEICQLSRRAFEALLPDQFLPRQLGRHLRCVREQASVSLASRG